MCPTTHKAITPHGRNSGSPIRLSPHRSVTSIHGSRSPRMVSEFDLRPTAKSDQYGICPNGNNLNKRRFTVDSAIVIRNYAYEDVAWNGLAFAYPAGGTGMKLNILDCVTMSPGPNGPLNHMEIRVAQNLLEVWASDAGSTALRKIATITNPNLSFSRGLIWIQDAHYNASKGACAAADISGNPVCQSSIHLPGTMLRSMGRSPTAISATTRSTTALRPTAAA